MSRYRAVLFDLFNTVALWRPDRMPTITRDGRTQPSTIGALGEVLAERVPELAVEAFHEALLATNEALSVERARDMREIPSVERFGRALLRAGQPETDRTRSVAQALTERHMALLAHATDVPEEHNAFLARVTARYPIALVSNFDHGPTARHILARDGAHAHFEHVVISDEHGWRKPHPLIFTDTIEALGVAPSEALFVGDSVEDDVVGAVSAGIDVAWVNAKGATLPDGAPAPRYEVTAITELAGPLLDESA